MSLLTPLVQFVITVANAIIGTAFNAVIIVITAFPTLSIIAAIMAIKYPSIQPSKSPIIATISESSRLMSILSLFVIIILIILLGRDITYSSIPKALVNNPFSHITKINIPRIKGRIIFAIFCLRIPASLIIKIRVLIKHFLY